MNRHRRVLMNSTPWAIQCAMRIPTDEDSEFYGPDVMEAIEEMIDDFMIAEIVQQEIIPKSHPIYAPLNDFHEALSGILSSADGWPELEFIQSHFRYHELCVHLKSLRAAFSAVPDNEWPRTYPAFEE